MRLWSPRHQLFLTLLSESTRGVRLTRLCSIEAAAAASRVGVAASAYVSTVLTRRIRPFFSIVMSRKLPPLFPGTGTGEILLGEFTTSSTQLPASLSHHVDDMPNVVARRLVAQTT